MEKDTVVNFKPKKVGGNVGNGMSDLRKSIDSLYEVTAIPDSTNPRSIDPSIQSNINEQGQGQEQQTNGQQLDLKAIADLLTKQNESVNAQGDTLNTVVSKLAEIKTSIADTVPTKKIPYTTGLKQIPVSTPTQPDNPFVVTDGIVPGYSVEEVSKNISDIPHVKNAPKIYLTIFGPGQAYIIFSSDGRNYANKETFVDEGGNQVFYNVFDIKIRSPTAGLQYQVSEQEIPLQRLSVVKAEKIETYSTLSAVNFDGAIPFNAMQTTTLTGLLGNKYFIRGVNMQSVLPLDFDLLFFGSDVFDTPGNLDTDTFLDSVEIDFTQFPAFRINNANQWRLSVSNLNIMYECFDITNSLHMGLLNLSPSTKKAGTAGAVQLDIKMSPRL